MSRSGLSEETVQRYGGRYRRIFFGGGSAVVAKAITALSAIISVPLTIHYLGDERFGLWMTISSLAAVVAYADFGLGNGLVSAVAHNEGRGEMDTLVRLVSSAFFSLLGVAAVLMALFSAAYPFIPFDRFFSVSSSLAAGEAKPAMLVFVVCFCANLPLVVSQRVQMGLQEFWLANFWIGLGNILGLLGLMAAIHAKAGLPGLTLALYGLPVVVTALGGVVEFWIRRPHLRPRWNRVSFDVLPNLWRTGIAFFLLQILTVLSLNIDNLIIAKMSNAATVAPYAVMARYAQLMLVVTVFLQPLWPAFGEALGRGDYEWARKAFGFVSVLTLAVSSLIAIVTALFGRQIIHLWVGPSLSLPPGLVVGMAATIIVLSYAGVVASFLNTEMLIRRQVKVYFLATTVAIAAKILFMHFWGVGAVPWGTVLGFGGIYCLFGANLAYRSIAQGEQSRSARCPAAGTAVE